MGVWQKDGCGKMAEVRQGVGDGSRVVVAAACRWQKGQADLGGSTTEVW